MNKNKGTSLIIILMLLSYLALITTKITRQNYRYWVLQGFDERLATKNTVILRLRQRERRHLDEGLFRYDRTNGLLSIYKHERKTFSIDGYQVEFKWSGDSTEQHVGKLKKNVRYKDMQVRYVKEFYGTRINIDEWYTFKQNADGKWVPVVVKNEVLEGDFLWKRYY